MKDSSEFSEWIFQLLRMGRKLHGIGYLIAHDHSTDHEPANIADIREGLGTVLQDLGTEINALSEKIEPTHMKNR